MHHMGRIADEGEAGRDEGARRAEAQRIGNERTFEAKPAELMAEAPRDLADELAFAERQKPFRLRDALRPDDRGAPTLERQDREWAAGKEMLIGASVMLALMRDRRGEAELLVFPGDPADPREFAAERARAIGRDEQRGRDHAP